MKIALYFRDSDPAGIRMRQEIAAEFGPDWIEAYASVTDVLSRLQRPRGDLGLLVLLTESRQSLRLFTLSKNLMDDLPLILVLPDTREQTVSMGHQLYPRFLCDRGENPAVVRQVIRRIAARMQPHVPKSGKA